MLNYAIIIHRRQKYAYGSKTISFQPSMPFDMLYKNIKYCELTGSTGDKEEVSKVFDFIDDGETVSLVYSSLIAEHLTETEAFLKTEEISRISYNKITKEYDGDVESIEIVQETDLASIHNIFKYVDVIASVNDVVHEYVAKISKKILTIPKLTYVKDKGSIVLKNLLCLLQNNILEVEKLINSNNSKILTKNLSVEGFRLTAAKKLSKTVGLPPFAMPLIKKIRIEGCVDSLNKLNTLVDGNDLRILLELLENSRNFLTIKKTGENARAREIRIREFIDSLVFLMSDERTNKYKLQDILNYVLRQSMYWSLSDDFEFPFEEMRLFVDYINMCEQNNLACDKYPQNIRRIHDVVLINVSVFDDVDETDFQNAVSKYKLYEMDLKDGYSFIVPESIHALIQEGNDLHHCIGSYANKIAKEQSIIMFMRKTSEKNIPFVTIEINSDCNIVEIKGIYNEEPEKDIIKVANKWAGICKRLSGK